MMSRPIVVHLVAGARPNFIKLAPLHRQLAKADWCSPVLIHTGQHYDPRLSDVLLVDLGLPPPDAHLGVGSGSHAQQTAGVMVAYEELCLVRPPGWVVVVGDVNSTLACALVAKKLDRPLAHLEAGLRSYDRSMPEEINRVVVDAIADLLWTPSIDADENLRREGVASERIHRVGNLLVDSYELLRPRIAATKTQERWGLRSRTFGVVTLHRPTNVDDASCLSTLVEALRTVAAKLPLVFPVHPRTRQRLERFGLWDRLAAVPGLIPTEPLGYIAFMSLIRGSRFVITDSGGVQEETTYLGVPCLTLRTSTERPITISEGTNHLAGRDDLPRLVERILDGDWSAGRRPERWDGRAAERAAATLRRLVVG